MAITTKVKTRVENKHDIEANWNKAVNFIPLKGELIIYDPDDTHKTPRIKIGNGVTKVTELAFINAEIETTISELIASGTEDPSDQVASKFYFKHFS